MAASRDDFVIAVRSAFLNKGTKQRFSLIVLIFFSLVLIVLTKFNFTPINYIKISVNEIIYRLSFIVSLPEKQIQKGINLIDDHLNVYDDYVDIKKKLSSMESKKINSEFLESENKRLRKLIDEYIISSDEMVAKVLIDKESPFLRSIIVNKGSKDNVILGMSVLDSTYLIGKVIEVNYSTSRVLLISDLNSKIPVSIEPGNVQSILSGTGKDFAKIQYFKNKDDISDYSLIYTSGSGGIFKPGIPIGYLDKRKDKENEEVKFFSNLTQLTFVKLILFKKIQ